GSSGTPLEAAGRPGAVRPEAALVAAGDTPLDAGRDARDREHEAEDHDAAEDEHRAQVVDPARVRDQAVDEFLHQRSISGATRSRLAITAIRSAIMRLRLTFGTMLMAANEPVRILQRYGNAVPSLTTYQPMWSRALSRRSSRAPAGGLML